MQSTTYAVIMAGGTGTRLWPRSREAHPKQLHAFLSDKTLIQETVADIRTLVDGDHTLIVTTEKYAAPIRAQVPSVKHYLIEPYKLGKLLAIGAAAEYLKKLDPQAVMVLLWADSYIGNKSAFIETLKLAVTAAEKGTNSIIGVNPAYAATQYGYIEMGEEIQPGIRRLTRFQEKPDAETAVQFVASGHYVWNPGISVWRVDKLLDLYRKFEPGYATALADLGPEIAQPDFPEQAALRLKDLPKVEIEDTIYPKARDLAVIPADIGWDDVGNWSAIKDLLQKEGSHIVGKHIGINTENALIHAQDKLIATIGLNNIIVIETDDAILIADKHQSQKVKEIVDQLKEQKLHEYL